MPWMAVEREYRFEGPNGPASLADLFESCCQLIVYRAFYGSEVTTYAAGWRYPERACVGCSFLADQVAHPAHLNARDTTLVFASRAPQAAIQGLKERMGWRVPWYTITDDFDADFGVDEWHGTNAFIREGKRYFRTYFINSRGDEHMGSTWSYLDITALGAPGGVGGFAGGLPANAALPMVELPRRVRQARIIADLAGVPRHGRGALLGAKGEWTHEAFGKRPRQWKQVLDVPRREQTNGRDFEVSGDWSWRISSRGGGGLRTWANKRARPQWLTSDMFSRGGWQFEGLTAKKSR